LNWLLIFHICTIVNYKTTKLPNEVVDILLVLGECHRNYRNASRLYGTLFWLSPSKP